MEHEIESPDKVKDTDSKKMQEEESVLWKVCVLCEAHMRKGEQNAEQ